jgi:hypothetical protein
LQVQSPEFKPQSHQKKKMFFTKGAVAVSWAWVASDAAPATGSTWPFGDHAGLAGARLLTSLAHRGWDGRPRAGPPLCVPHMSLACYPSCCPQLRQRLQLEMERMKQMHQKDHEDQEEELEDVRQSCQKRVLPGPGPLVCPEGGRGTGSSCHRLRPPLPGGPQCPA